MMRREGNLHVTYREIDLRDDGSSVPKVFAPDSLVSASKQLKKRRPALVLNGRFSAWVGLAVSWMRADGAGSELSHA